MTKAEIIQKGLSLGVRLFRNIRAAMMLMTIGEACGECDACVLRKMALIMPMSKTQPDYQ